MANSNITYIHYGSCEFDPTLFTPVHNGVFLGKPAERTGLWASRINDENGWKAWCKHNDFGECQEDNAFCFTLSDDANVIIVDHPMQLEKLPMIKPFYFDEDSNFFDGSNAHLDFEAMIEQGVDAFEVIWHPLFEDALWGWDCGCIFIMNPNIVIPM